MLLVLQPELTARQLFGAGSPMAPLLPRAAIGLMNAAVPGPKTPPSAYLTIGAGHRVPAGPLTAPICFPSEPLEGDTALAVYHRRLQPPNAPSAVSRPSEGPPLLHPEWALFLNRARTAGPSRAAEAAGGLGEALRAHGGATWIGVGPAARDRWGALAAIDRAGIVPRGVELNEVSPAALRPHLLQSPLTVLDLPRGFPLERLHRLLTELARDSTLDLLLVSPYPRPGPGGDWDSLPPLLGVGPGFPPGMLTSATTRTPGLVANIDVAPTILDRLSVLGPDTISGRRMRTISASAVNRVLQLDQEATLSQRAVVPLGIGAGGAAVCALLLSLIAVARPRSEPASTRSGRTWQSTADRPAARTLPRLAHAAILFVAASPLAFLLVPLVRAETIPNLGAATAALAGTLALLQQGVPAWRRRPVPWLFLITALVLSVDVLLGCHLVARSPISGYAVTGIRFYGLGNEYMGVLVGTAILGALAVEDRLPRFGWVHVGFFAAILLLIGSPVHGADLGGALTAAAGFATVLVVAAGHRRSSRSVAGVAAFLVITGALFLIWDALRPEAARSHVGDFARSLTDGGWATAAAILAGKARMALRLAGSSYALLPLIGVAPLLGLWYHGAGRWLHSLMEERPEARGAIVGALVASGSALLFNDSGISSWMFIMAALLAWLLDEQLRERL